MGKLKNEFNLGLPQHRWVCGRWLGIVRCEGGPGGPLMLRSTKLQKRASGPEGAKMGVPKFAPPNSLDLGSLAHGTKIGGAKSNPHVCPLGVSCP